MKINKTTTLTFVGGAVVGSAITKIVQFAIRKHLSKKITNDMDAIIDSILEETAGKKETSLSDKEEVQPEVQPEQAEPDPKNT